MEGLLNALKNNPSLASNLPNMQGMDPSKLGKQAEQLWKMLDDMAENDPKGYQTFIQKQMKEAKQDESKRNDTHSLTPTPGYTIQTQITKHLDTDSSIPKEFSIGTPIYLNICSHKAVQAPQLPSGEAVLDTTTGIERTHEIEKHYENLSVPFTIGPLRSIQMKTKGGHACDVIFHPWTVHYAERNLRFQTSLNALAIEWAGKEHAFLFDMTRFHVLPSSTCSYMGGTGSKGTSPVPYKIPKSTTSTASNPMEHSATNKTEKNVSQSIGGIMTSPSQLLHQLRLQENDLPTTVPPSNSANQKDNSGQTPATKKPEAAPLISEVQDVSSNIPIHQVIQEDGKLIVSFDLKERASSMHDLELDVEPELVSLRIITSGNSGSWSLNSLWKHCKDLPDRKKHRINIDAVKAKFMKKSKQLKVTLEVV